VERWNDGTMESVRWNEATLVGLSTREELFFRTILNSLALRSSSLVPLVPPFRYRSRLTSATATSPTTCKLARLTLSIVSYWVCHAG
jgi:hypothetical protein